MNSENQVFPEKAKNNCTEVRRKLTGLCDNFVKDISFFVFESKGFKKNRLEIETVTWNLKFTNT